MVCQIEDSDVKKNTLSYVPHLTFILPYLEPHSSSSLSPSSSSSLSLLQLITVCFPTLSHPLHIVSSSPNKQNETSPQHGVNNSLTFKIVVSYWAGPYLLGILSSTPESQTAPVGGTPYPTAPLLAGLVGSVGSPCCQALLGNRKGEVFCRGDFFVGRIRMIVRLLLFPYGVR